MYNSSNALYHNLNLKPCFCYNTEKKIARIDYSNWTSYNNNLVVSSLLLKPISFIWILITLFIYLFQNLSMALCKRPAAGTTQAHMGNGKHMTTRIDDRKWNLKAYI